ncbi:hypothetical protein CDD83_8704 [Cordyceps sp. RAO-2017]|nr:hypothetical protein CDD83_8704 [Cordyceps sp. RAO-2017]
MSLFGQVGESRRCDLGRGTPVVGSPAHIFKPMHHAAIGFDARFGPASCVPVSSSKIPRSGYCTLDAPTVQQPATATKALEGTQPRSRGETSADLSTATDCTVADPFRRPDFRLQSQRQCFLDTYVSDAAPSSQPVERAGPDEAAEGPGHRPRPPNPTSPSAVPVGPCRHPFEIHVHNASGSRVAKAYAEPQAPLSRSRSHAPTDRSTSVATAVPESMTPDKGPAKGRTARLHKASSA